MKVREIVLVIEPRPKYKFDSNHQLLCSRLSGIERHEEVKYTSINNLHIIYAIYIQPIYLADKCFATILSVTSYAQPISHTLWENHSKVSKF